MSETGERRKSKENGESSSKKKSKPRRKLTIKDFVLGESSQPYNLVYDVSVQGPKITLPQLLHLAPKVRRQWTKMISTRRVKTKAMGLVSDLETSVDEFSSSEYSTSEEESTVTDESDSSQANIMGVMLNNPTMVSSINVPQVDEGFIYPVEDSEWVSPVVVTPKKNGKWRVCVDYKPLNAATKRDHFPLPFQDEILNEVAGYERYTVFDGYSRKLKVKAPGPEPVEVQAKLSGAHSLYFDGAYKRKVDKASVGISIQDENGQKVFGKGLLVENTHSNNEAKYAALAIGLEWCVSMGIKRLNVFGDALLLIKQVHGTWACRNQSLVPRLRTVKELMKRFEAIQLYHVPRKGNQEADALADEQLQEVIVGTIKLQNPLF
ncbi:hypothetical protein L7F22_038568 [Adiantum nelumboides]|nr:hypothetical protein [Adiantum nelumboides]